MSPASPFKVRRVERPGPRGGGWRVDWDVYDVRREEDADGGWCQTYGSKREAVAGAAAREQEREERQRRAP